MYSKDRLPGPPAAVLTDNDNILPIKGIALDLACGLGTNSLFLAARGLEVHAWDISKVAVSHLAERAGSLGLNIQTRVINITAAALPVETYDLVITSHYLDRSLPPAILDATRPGGLICYQTFTAEKQINMGPGNPVFLLQPNELQSFVPDCEILAFKDESHNANRDDPLAGRAFIIARKPIG
ncbi:MAG TPA: methyltransferase domain-containing protein [Gammaproteobacteria bacterium]|nr:methyltransferase domain-containing protein [Gammaproteobacteria bacterium]